MGSLACCAMSEGRKVNGCRWSNWCIANLISGVCVWLSGIVGNVSTLYVFLTTKLMLSLSGLFANGIL